MRIKNEIAVKRKRNKRDRGNVVGKNEGGKMEWSLERGVSWELGKKEHPGVTTTSKPSRVLLIPPGTSFPLDTVFPCILVLVFLVLSVVCVRSERFHSDK